VKPSRQWILYTVLRFGIFAVVLTALLVLLPQIAPWISAIIAAVIGLCVTYIFFRPQRDAVVRSFAEYRTTEHRDADNDAENDALDTAGHTGPTAPAGGERLEGERGGEGDAVEERGEARELEGEDELGGALPGQRDDDRR